MVNELRFKTDVQQAIANEIKEYETSYNNLIFDNNTKEFLKTLFFLENLKINVKNNKLNFKIKLNENKLKMISAEDLEKIKLADLNIRLQDLAVQKAAIKIPDQEIAELVNNLTDEFIDKMFDTEIDNKTYRKATQEEKDKMIMIRDILKNDFNIDFKLEESENFLSLSANLENVEFDYKMIAKLHFLAKQIDIFSILPYMEEATIDSEKINGARLFFAIKLSEENKEEF